MTKKLNDAFDETNLDDTFDSLAGFAKMPSVAKNFYFGTALPRANFPADFVAYYAQLSQGEPVDWDRDRIYFLAPFASEIVVCMYDGFFSPQSIQTQNAIISQSIYADSGSVILPLHHYAIGRSYSQREQRILIDLNEASATYGHLFAWHLAHDPLGTGDNCGGLAHIATSLQAFFEGLQTQSAIKRKTKVTSQA
jgi:hypothetical protein